MKFDSTTVILSPVNVQVEIQLISYGFFQISMGGFS